MSATVRFNAVLKVPFVLVQRKNPSDWAHLFSCQHWRRIYYSFPQGSDDDRKKVSDADAKRRIHHLRNRGKLFFVLSDDCSLTISLVSLIVLRLFHANVIYSIYINHRLRGGENRRTSATHRRRRRSCMMFDRGKVILDWSRTKVLGIQLIWLFREERHRQGYDRLTTACEFGPPQARPFHCWSFFRPLRRFPWCGGGECTFRWAFFVGEFSSLICVFCCLVE